MRAFHIKSWLCLCSFLQNEAAKKKGTKTKEGKDWIFSLSTATSTTTFLIKPSTIAAAVLIPLLFHSRSFVIITYFAERRRGTKIIGSG